MSEVLDLYKGQERWLLLRSPQCYHLIRTQGLSEEQMEKLLRIYPCRNDRLKAMGYHFSAFKKVNLQRVLVTGFRAGATLELRIGTDMRKFTLGQKTTLEELEEFFSGTEIVHRPAPVWKGWDQGLIRKVTWVVNGTAIAAGLEMWLFWGGSKAWSWLGILSLLTSILLMLSFPDSFAFAEGKDKGHLFWGIMAVALGLAAQMEGYTMENGAFLRLVGLAALPVLLLLPLIWRSTLRANFRLLETVSVAFHLLLCGSLTMHRLNGLMEFDPPARTTAWVLETGSHGSRSIHYDCTVQLPDGEILELDIAFPQYKSMEAGDEIQVLHYDGAFGVPFRVVELPQK